MARGVEASHRVAELALGALKKIGLAASPRNIEIWCAHVDGKNPALSRDMQAATDKEGYITQTQLDELYKKYIQRADLSRDVIDIVTRFREEVSELHDAIEETGEHAHDHNETLTGINEQLRQTTEEYPAVGKLLEDVIAVTKSMREENEKLETRLADSAGEIAALQRNVEHIQAEAQKDPLTGVANRGEFDKALAREIKHASENNEPLALVLADIDHFKSFNDKWGHQTGDQVLRLVAEVMNANVKGQDMLARYGGEEFAIILPGTTMENAEMLANRIRFAVESRRLKKRRTDEDLGVVTMSMGISAHSEEDTSESMVERADKCLYAAKEAGRNCVISENGKAEDEHQRAAG